MKSKQGAEFYCLISSACGNNLIKIVFLIDHCQS